MRKVSIIFLITIAFTYILSGCTMMPKSQETGVGPKEYTEIKNTEVIKNENISLKEELNKTKTEIEKMEKDYLTLAKNNDSVLSKLEEAETKLDILKNEGIPKFISEENDKNSIVAYLNNNKNVLEKRLRGIEIVNSQDEDNILFYTTGYGDEVNQLFIWKAGKNEPVLINGANFDAKGSIDWINNKILQINTGNGEYKLLSVDSGSIISTFFSKQDAYLIPGTSTYIIQKEDSKTFAVYDFINLKEQEIVLNYKGKFTSFKINEDNIIFNGIYTDENEIQYTVEAVMNLNKMKEKYNIVTMDETIKIKENKVEVSN